MNIISELKKKTPKDIWNRTKSFYIEFGIYEKDFSKKKLMFIMQNPGKYNENKEQKHNFDKINNNSEFIKISRIALKDWLEGRNISFWDKFKKIVPAKKDLFQELYFTDLIKLRGNTGDFDPRNKKTEKSRFEEKPLKEFMNLSKEILITEIELCKPKLIFAISTRTWDFFRTQYKNELKRLTTKKYSDKNKIENVSKEHGHLFQIKKSLYVIPLAHFS